MAEFDADIYRRNSQDLHHLSEDALRAHFHSVGVGERRVYGRTDTTVERMSMRWLRGHGVEIGAGRNPIPLFGNAERQLADIGASTSFGGEAEWIFNIEDENIKLEQKLDFVVAGHVLEHCDSFIRALGNLLSLVNENGVVYVILPDKRYLHDRHWLPDYDFEHHLAEWREPLIHAREHDTLFLSGITTDVRINDHAEYPEDVARALENGVLPADQRFLSHKHNYRFAGWIRLIEQTLETLKSPFVIEDCGFGRERMDCHFVLLRR